MDKATALQALAALGQETRLEVFRLLVRAGAKGVPAGEIATRLSTVQNTMSAHLKIRTRSSARPGWCVPNAKGAASATRPT